jgi:WD40 repeat protein
MAFRPAFRAGSVSDGFERAVADASGSESKERLRELDGIAMPFRLHFVLPFCVIFLWPLQATAQGKTPRIDAFGDPLPDGAIVRLGTTRFQDPNYSAIEAVNFTADGKTMATMGLGVKSDLRVRLWDALTGKQHPHFELDISYPLWRSQLLASDGSFVALAHLTYVLLWDTKTGKGPRQFGSHPGHVLALAFTAGGKEILAAVQNGTVHRWDVASETLKQSSKVFEMEPKLAKNGTELKKRFGDALFSPDGKTLVGQFFWGTEPKYDPLGEEVTVVADVATGKELWRMTVKGLVEPRFAFSPDGKQLAVWSYESDVSLFEVATGKLLAKMPVTSKYAGFSRRVTALAFAPDGKTLAVAGPRLQVTLWSTEDPKKRREMTARTVERSSQSIDAVAFTPHGKKLVVTVGGSLQLFNVAPDKDVPLFAGHRGPVDWLTFTADGKLQTGCASDGGYAEELLTWDPATWKPTAVSVVENLEVWRRKIASADHGLYLDPRGDGFIDKSGKSLGKLQLPDKLKAITGGSFSPSGRLFVIAVSGDNSQHVFEVPSGKWLCSFPAGPIAAFSPEESQAAINREGESLEVYDTSTGKRLHRLGQAPAPNPFAGQQVAVAFSGDGKQLAVWHRDQPGVRIWNLTTGKQRLELGTEIVGKAPGKMSLAWSPGDRMLAVGNLTGEPHVQLWEVATGQVRRVFRGHAAALRALAFSPDGRLLASGSDDTTVLVWAVYGPGFR